MLTPPNLDGNVQGAWVKSCVLVRSRVETVPPCGSGVQRYDILCGYGLLSFVIASCFIVVEQIIPRDFDNLLTG